MPLGVRVLVEVGAVPAGSSPAIIMQQQAAEPGQGTTQQAHAGFMAQVRLYRDFELVPAATDATVTVANILTAINAAANVIAGTTNPLITPTELAIIQNWPSGGT